MEVNYLAQVQWDHISKLLEGPYVHEPQSRRHLPGDPQS